MWSAIDAEVRAVQAAVDQQRFDVLVESAFEILRDKHQAQVFASWALYLLVGYEQAALPPATTATSRGSPPNCSTRWIRVGSARLPRTS